MYVIRIIFIIILFCLGLNFVINQPTIEGFADVTGRCPNVLIQRGTTLYLSNSKLAEVPGVNPLKFNNLDEYVQFMKWQRSQGIDCDILFVQEEYDTQGNGILVQRTSPLEKEGGMPVITGLNLVNTNNHSSWRRAERERQSMECRIQATPHQAGYY